MIHNSEWYLVENQISDELLEDENSLKIVEKLVIHYSAYTRNNEIVHLELQSTVQRK